MRFARLAALVTFALALLTSWQLDGQVASWWSISRPRRPSASSRPRCWRARTKWSN